MKEQTIAKAYAASITELANEANVNAADELIKFSEVINVSNDLENVLFLDVFTVDEKLSVFEALSEKVGLHKLTHNFVTYLIKEKRINLFPSIYKEVVVIDDHNKGFLRGTIEGASDQITEDDKNKITNFLKEKLGINPTLDYQKSERVSAGYRVTAGDYQLDASIDTQLEKFKQSVLGN